MKVKSGTWKADIFALSVWGLLVLSFFYPLWLKPDHLWAGPDTSIYLIYKFYWIRSLLEGDPAFWNPYFSLGCPFLAHPSTGVFSLFNVFYFFLPICLVNTLTYMFYFVWAAYGSYRCLRLWGVDWIGGFFGGTIYAWSGFFVHHAYAGQCSMVWAAAWIPWIFYFFMLGWEKKSLSIIGLSSLSAAFAFFEGYPQITYYGLLATTLYGFILWSKNRFSFFGIKLFLMWGGLFLLLSSAQLLPTYFFSRVSNRADWGWGNHMTDYLSLENLKLFFDPWILGSPLDGSWWGRWGHHEINNYIGIIPLVFFLSSIFLIKNFQMRCMLFLVFLFTVLSLGESTPFSREVFKFFYEFVPGFDQHRSIGRMMVISTWGMAICSGLVLDYFQNLLRGKRFLIVLVVALTTVEVWSYGRKFLRIMHKDYYMSEKGIFPEVVLEKVMKDPDYPRIRPANVVWTNMVHRLSQLPSQDGFLLKDNVLYGAAAQDHINSSLVDLIGLKYIHASKKEHLDTAKWEEIIPDHYLNRSAYPRAFLIGGYKPGAGETYHAIQWLLKEEASPRDVAYVPMDENPPFPSHPGKAGEVQISHYGNNRVILQGEASRPCLLVLADLNDGFWHAKLNKETVAIVRAFGAFRGVWIPQMGKFQVEMFYQPWPIGVGTILSLLGFLILGVFWFKGGKLTKMKKNL